MADATLLFATHQHEEASQLCMDIIRLAPNMADVYHTMGMLMEAMGDPRRCSRGFDIQVSARERELDGSISCG